jgi:hypothetical protein
VTVKGAVTSDTNISRWTKSVHTVGGIRGTVFVNGFWPDGPRLNLLLIFPTTVASTEVDLSDDEALFRVQG